MLQSVFSNPSIRSQKQRAECCNYAQIIDPKVLGPERSCPGMIARSKPNSRATQGCCRLEVTPPIPVAKAIRHLKRPNTHGGMIAGRYELSAPVSLASANKSVYSLSRNSLEKAGRYCHF